MSRSVLLLLLVAACAGERAPAPCRKLAKLPPGQAYFGGWHDHLDATTAGLQPPAQHARNAKRLALRAGPAGELAFSYVFARFTAADLPFPVEHLDALHGQFGPAGIVPFVTVNLYEENARCPAGTDCFFHAVTSGAHDALIRGFRDRLRRHVLAAPGRTVMLSLDGEMNAGWPGVPDDPAVHVAAVRHFYDVLAEDGTDRLVTWVYFDAPQLFWEEDGRPMQGKPFGAYYPGDAAHPYDALFISFRTGEFASVVSIVGAPGFSGCESIVESLRAPYHPRAPAGIYAQAAAVDPTLPIFLELTLGAVLGTPPPLETDHCVVTNPAFSPPKGPGNRRGITELVGELFTAFAAGEFPRLGGIGYWGDRPEGMEEWDLVISTLFDPLDGTDPLGDPSDGYGWPVQGVMEPFVSRFREHLASPGIHLRPTVTERCE